VAQAQEGQGAEGAAGRHVDLQGEQGPRRAWAPRGLDHPSRNHQVGQSRGTRHDKNLDNDNDNDEDDVNDDNENIGIKPTLT